MVRIRFYGKTKKPLGAETRSIPIEGEIRLGDLIKRMTEDETSASREFSVILVNGRNCIFTGGLETRIANGDLVEILPLVTGG